MPELSLPATMLAVMLDDYLLVNLLDDIAKDENFLSNSGSYLLHAQSSVLQFSMCLLIIVNICGLEAY